MLAHLAGGSHSPPKPPFKVDAEHTYLQPAIDHAVLHLQRKYNTAYPAIYSTYQAYLHDCVPRLYLDMERAKREGWHFGAKLVRGAYMVRRHLYPRNRTSSPPVPWAPSKIQAWAPHSGAAS